MWMLPLGIGVDERSGEAGMRGEVCVRRIAGRGVMALRGEPSGGVDTEEDTDEEPEAVALSVLRTSWMGFEREITGERGDLLPWIWS